MPHAHNLVLCVDIENTLKILKNTHAPHPQLVLCVILKIPLKYSCPMPTTLYCV